LHRAGNTTFLPAEPVAVADPTGAGDSFAGSFLVAHLAGAAPEDAARSAMAAVHAMLPYIEAHLSAGGRLHQITRHMLGLFAGRPGARAWRRILSEGAARPDAGPELLEEALTLLRRSGRERAVAG